VGVRCVSGVVELVLGFGRAVTYKPPRQKIAVSCIFFEVAIFKSHSGPKGNRTTIRSIRRLIMPAERNAAWVLAQ